MTQPYYAGSVDDLCPSFKKLRISNPTSKGWSIVPFSPSCIFRKLSHGAIVDLTVHEKLKRSQHISMPIKLLKQQDRNLIMLTKLKLRQLPIEDIPKAKIKDDDKDDEMNVD
ncbi:hypothetical protein BMR1_02g04130 [Babesia microti strain RI]|uniref:Uncharacterized protein n=1 Tax=Babesia microti (strain RI) TaxID=1133968 RepID=I7J6Q9_BABMR|nr:hypothetical protein BMR1_02g04130 [Babesia microti strain RI]CCF73972.1 hypothetical protein BMR1_02g04130 [Babesia microti strain RI]|eukprot:XP_012648581.1 hypothetical protein BMR1_02g04130 [Babesia microti strain RI]